MTLSERIARLDWLFALAWRCAVILAAVAVFAFLIRESLAPPYPPAPDFTGQDQSAPIGYYGNGSIGDN